MGVVQTYICTAKLRDKNDKIVGYDLRNISTNQQQRVEPLTLKKFMDNRTVNILNLQLTSDGRLIDKEIENTDKVIRDENFNKFINILINKYGKTHIESVLTNPYKKYTLKEIPLYNTFFGKATLSMEGTSNPNEFIFSFKTESMETDYSREKQDWEQSKIKADKQLKATVNSIELETLLNRIKSTFKENKGSTSAAIDCLGICLVDSNDEVPLLRQYELDILCKNYEITKKDFYDELIARYNKYNKQQCYKDTSVILSQAIKKSKGANAKYIDDSDVYDAYIAYEAITSSTEKSDKLSKIVYDMIRHASVLWLHTEIFKYRASQEQRVAAANKAVSLVLPKETEHKTPKTKGDILKNMLNMWNK